MAQLFRCDSLQVLTPQPLSPVYTPLTPDVAAYFVRQKATSVWEPQEGPQTTYKHSTAYELLYGGAAGGGKSWALSHDGLDYAKQGGNALLLRRSFPELQELIDLLLPSIAKHGGTWKEQKKRAEFPNGGALQFGYLSTYKEVHQYQGRQYGWIGYDELGHVLEERVWTYLMSRNRSTNRLPKVMRASANPGGIGHHWIKRRFIANCQPDGTIYTETLKNGSTTTRAFIQSFLSDNPKLTSADPAYENRLELLPEIERAWLKDGDWNAGAGMGLADFQQSRHVTERRTGTHLRYFGSFDWGYNHPFAFGLFSVDEDANVQLVRTVTGRRLQPPEIAHRVLSGLTELDLDFTDLDYTVGGHDIKAEHKARGETVHTIQDQCAELGWYLDLASISRVAGVQNIRRYLMWKDAEGKEFTPRFTIAKHPSNTVTIECLESRVSDPDHIEDILKTNADEHGVGGDDTYDMVRYGLASRPITATLPKDKIVPSHSRDYQAQLIDTSPDEAHEGGTLSQFSWGM